MCELDGTLSITYRDLTKNVVSESLDFFKNLATQTQQSIFLINKAKTNFDQDDWERSSLEVVQYWELQDEDLFRKLNYTFDPSPIWINPKATWEQKKTPDPNRLASHYFTLGNALCASIFTCQNCN